MTLPSSVQSLLARAERASKSLDFVAPLVSRVTLGVLFTSTGWGKLHSLDQVTAFFAELGIPAPALQAPFVAGVEFFGGVLLLAGLASRIAAVPLMVSMLVAIVTAQRSEVQGLADLFGLVEWTYFALLLYVALSGPGRISLDHLVARARNKTRGSKALPSELAAKPA